jgi:hypothetical protein
VEWRHRVPVSPPGPVLNEFLDKGQTDLDFTVQRTVGGVDLFGVRLRPGTEGPFRKQPGAVLLEIGRSLVRAWEVL